MHRHGNIPNELADLPWSLTRRSITTSCRQGLTSRRHERLCFPPHSSAAVCIVFRVSITERTDRTASTKRPRSCGARRNGRDRPGSADARLQRPVNTDTPLMSRRSTVMSRLCASMFTSPKNCRPLNGDRLDCPAGGALTNTTCGPKVPSSTFGPKVPALSGPATNSQKPSKSRKAALRRIVVVRRAVVHVGGQPHHVAHLLALEIAEQFGELQLAPFRGAGLAVGHGFPAPLGPSPTLSPSGMSAATTFQTARELCEARLQPVQLLAAKEHRLLARRRSAGWRCSGRDRSACRSRRAPAAARSCSSGRRAATRARRTAASARIRGTPWRRARSAAARSSRCSADRPRGSWRRTSC